MYQGSRAGKIAIRIRFRGESYGSGIHSNHMKVVVGQIQVIGLLLYQCPEGEVSGPSI